MIGSIMDFLDDDAVMISNANAAGNHDRMLTYAGHEAFCDDVGEKINISWASPYFVGDGDDNGSACWLTNWGSPSVVLGKGKDAVIRSIIDAWEDGEPVTFEVYD